MNSQLINEICLERQAQLIQALANADLALDMTIKAIYRRDEQLQYRYDADLEADLLINSQQLSFDWLI